VFYFIVFYFYNKNKKLNNINLRKTFIILLLAYDTLHIVYLFFMGRKFLTYTCITIGSFCFFTVVFNTVAYAQSPQIISLVQPTPTLTLLPNKKPLIQTASEKRTMITPSPTETQTKQTPTPTPTKKQTEPTLTPTTAPTATQTPTPTPQTTLPQTTIPGGINAEKLFSMVNTHRASLGLPALQQDEKTCNLAATRAPEIAAEMATGTLHSGMYARNLPYWNTENASAYGTEEEALQWWLTDSIHRQAIESSIHTTSCVACSGNYCVQEFTSYQQK